MNLENFKAGMFVRFIPQHANGDNTHPDCEMGVVTSRNDIFVFVRFGLNTHSQACKADQLQRVL